MAKRNVYGIAGILIVIVVVIAIFMLQPQTGVEARPDFDVKINNCTLDGTEQGILSFSFDVNVTEGATRVPGQIVFQIIDYYKDYSFHRYKFNHKTNLTREYKLGKVYRAGDVIKDMPVVIDNVYRDYMYLPSEFFNYQFYYCQYTDAELEQLKESKMIFEVLDDECQRFFDFEHFYKDHMYSINQHAGEQCTYIPRYASDG